MRWFILTIVLASIAALAQVPTFDATAAEATRRQRIPATVTGGRIYLLADGGCGVQVEVSAAGIVVQPRVRSIRPQVCAAITASLTNAARLELGVADGGAP